jgi:hypothetical protein
LAVASSCVELNAVPYWIAAGAGHAIAGVTETGELLRLPQPFDIEVAKMNAPKNRRTGFMFNDAPE